MAARTAQADTVSATKYTADVENLKGELSKARRRIRDLEYERTRVRQKPIPEQAIMALAALPTWMQASVQEVVTDKTMREIVMEVLERRNEFSSEHVALLAGIGMNRKARDHVNKALDKHWREPKTGNFYNTVIVGGGLHAAIYVSVMAKMPGRTRALVIETEHVGGVFACSQGPSFFLNSPNRAGDGISVPGRGGALNYLPGCDVQPADLDGAEYQTNDVMAWAIRTNLALNADVWLGPKVKSTAYRTVYDKNGKQLTRAGDRVIVATGLGNEKRLLPDAPKARYVTFTEFMAMTEKPFPMRGMNRIAVLGGGDSGKCVIEALIGQGPKMLTMASLDRPEICWYGVKSSCRTRGDWLMTTRSRYKGIGRALQNDSNSLRTCRVRLRGNENDRYKATVISMGVNCVYVNGEPYDMVIDCTGWETPQRPIGDITPTGSVTDQNGSQWGATFTNGFIIGCASIPYINPSSIDQGQFKNVGENKTSIFYLGKKTEGVAMRLSGVGSF